MASGTFKNNYKGYVVRTEWASSMNVENNSSTIISTHYLDCGVTYDLYISARKNTATVNGEPVEFTSPGISTAGNSTIKLGITQHTVEHNPDGTKTVSASTKFLMQASIAGTWVESITATGVMVLDDIPRASTLTASNGILGTPQTLKIERASDIFTHTIKYTCGSVTPSTIVTKTAEVSIPWTPPLSLASQNTTGTTVSITFELTTYNVNTGATIGTSTKTITCTIPNSVKPTANVTVSDAMGYATTYGGYIQGMSKFKVTVTGTPIYNSPIASYSITANGATYTNSTITTDVIQNAGTATITGKVTDKRGNPGTKSVTVTVLAYDKPKVTQLSVIRCNQNGTENMQGEYAKITYSCSITTLGGKNTLTAKVKYKKIKDSEYTTITDINASTTASFTNKSIIIPAISGSSYDIEVDITDKFTTTPRTTSVSTAFTFHHYKGPNVEAEGKNKFNYENESNYVKLVSTLSKIDNGIRTTRNSNSQYTTYTYGGYIIRDIEDMLGKTWNLSYIATPNGSNDPQVRVYWWDKTAGTFKSYVTIFTTNNGGSFTLPAVPPADNYCLAIFFYSTGAVAVPTTDECYIDYTYIQLEEGSSATTYEPYIPEYAASMGLGKIAEFEGGLDIGFMTRFFNGLKYPVLLPETDLDDVRTPNFYAGENISTYNYVNCPLSSGTFYLEVVAMGDEGQIRQTIASCSKTDSVTYERFYYEGTWGEWRDCFVSEEVLYNNASGSTGTITLSKAASQYVYLEIYFTDNNGSGSGHTKVYSPDGKTADLSLIEPSGTGTTYFRRTKYTISGTSITPNIEFAGYVKISNTAAATTSATNYIKITRVIGKR